MAHIHSPLSAPLEAPSNNRENGFDIMRGIAIMGVVYIHSAKLFSPDYPLLLNDNYFRWAVPIFLILSALFSIKSINSRNTSAGSFLSYRYKKLVPPFFIFSLIHFLLSADWNTLSALNFLTRHFSGSGWPGQYFFIVLFQLLLFYPFLAKTPTKKSTLIISSLLTLILLPVASLAMDKFSIVNKIGDKFFLYWLPYSLIGVYFAQNKDAFRQLPSLFNKWVAGTVCFLIPLLIILENDINPLGVELRKGSGQSDYVSPYVLDSVYISSLIFFIFSPSLFSAWKGPVFHYISLLGRYSFGIFCIHPLILMGMGHLFAPGKWLFHIPFLLQAISPIFTVFFLCISSILILRLIKLTLGREILS